MSFEALYPQNFYTPKQISGYAPGGGRGSQPSQNSAIAKILWLGLSLGLGPLRWPTGIPRGRRFCAPLFFAYLSLRMCRQKSTETRRSPFQWLPLPPPPACPLIYTIRTRFRAAGRPRVEWFDEGLWEGRGVGEIG